MQQFIKIAGNGRKTARDMSHAEASEAMSMLMEGQASMAQAATFMAVLRIKEETGTELAAFATTLRRYCQTIEVERERLVDICLPYDGRSKELSLTPVAACIAAGAGAAVALHGRLGFTTPPKFGLGIGDTLAELGAPVHQTLAQGARLLEQPELGLAFVSTDRFAPRLEEFNKVREEYGLRSFFNSVEKLLNPFGASTAVVGVFHGPVLPRVAVALQAQGYRRGLAVHGPEGSLDVLPSRVTKIVEFGGSVESRETAQSLAAENPCGVMKLQTWTLDPAEFGWRRQTPSQALEADAGRYPPNQPANATFEIDGTTGLPYISARMNAQITLRILQNRDYSDEEFSWQRRGAILSAALLIYAAGISGSIQSALKLAQGSLESGAALERLERWRRAGSEAGAGGTLFTVLNGSKQTGEPDLAAGRLKLG